MEVGFIGVGRMGKAMARNLMKAGHRVRAWDTSKAALEEIARDGAEIAASARDAFRGDAVMSMLPNDEAMWATFVTGGALPGGGTSTVHVNSATASVACVRELAKVHAARGVPYVSAPVYGRPEMAAERNLNIMAAGDAAAIARVQPLFDAIGKKTWRLGEAPPNANIAKIAGNLMVAGPRSRRWRRGAPGWNGREVRPSGRRAGLTRAPRGGIGNVSLRDRQPGRLRRGLIP